jgi:hypothetical protein
VRGQSRPQAEGIGIANLVLGDHPANFMNSEGVAIQNRFRFVAHIVRTRLHWARQKEMTAFVSKARGCKVITQRDKLAILGKLVTGFFAKFAQRDLLSGFVDGAVNLTRWHFPNCRANGDPFLANENDSAVPRHRRNDHGCFTVNDCPSPWERT